MTDESSGKPNTSAKALALVALGIALLALLMAFYAVRTANQTASQKDELESKVEEVMSIPEDQASPGGGVGDNQNIPTVPTESGNTMPNGNGQ